jgi:hypothetical protein
MSRHSAVLKRILRTARRSPRAFVDLARLRPRRASPRSNSVLNVLDGISPPETGMAQLALGSALRL